MAMSWHFFLHIRPVLSSSKALGLTAQSLHQCCRAQCSHAMNRVPCGETMDLCLQFTLVHGSTVGTATPKQPKFNLLHISSRNYPPPPRPARTTLKFSNLTETTPTVVRAR